MARPAVVLLACVLLLSLAPADAHHGRGSHGGTAPPPPPPPSPNQAPTAALIHDAHELYATFDASASADPDGDTLRYTWDFGDGTTVATASPHASHAYAEAGRYTASVTVSDGRGGLASAPADVSVAPQAYEGMAGVHVETGGWTYYTFPAGPVTDAGGQPVAQLLDIRTASCACMPAALDVVLYVATDGLPDEASHACRSDVALAAESCQFVVGSTWATYYIGIQAKGAGGALYLGANTGPYAG